MLTRHKAPLRLRKVYHFGWRKIWRDKIRVYLYVRICVIFVSLARAGLWLLFNVSWLFRFLCFTSSVSLTDSCTEDEPKIHRWWNLTTQGNKPLSQGAWITWNKRRTRSSRTSKRCLLVAKFFARHTERDNNQYCKHKIIMAQLEETMVQVVACRYSTFIHKGYGQSQY